MKKYIVLALLINLGSAIQITKHTTHKTKLHAHENPDDVDSLEDPDKEKVDTDKNDLNSAEEVNDNPSADKKE